MPSKSTSIFLSLNLYIGIIFNFLFINSLMIKYSFFGFSRLSSYFLSIYLTYQDVDIIGNQSFGFGNHNLKIERITGDAPKTIRVSSTDVESSELITRQE